MSIRFPHPPVLGLQPAGRAAPAPSRPLPLWELPGPGCDLRRLGERLIAAAPDVGALLAGEAPADRDEELREALAEMGCTLTLALGRWMAGGGEQAARDTGARCLSIFGQLASRRVALLDEMVRCCLRWREAVGELAAGCAVQLGLSPQALAEGLSMAQRSLDVTLVRLCESFESERRQIDQELRFLARHDMLTGLPNRAVISERAGELLERSRRGGCPLALLFVDLDNFKVVNDTLGHGAGDELLRSVTGRLREVVGEPDLLGRFGGDEFVVVVGELACAQAAQGVARRVLDALAEPFTLASGSTRLWVSASVGVAVAEARPVSVEGLLRDADIAMYRAKRAGKGRFAVIASREVGADPHLASTRGSRASLACSGEAPPA